MMSELWSRLREGKSLAGERILDNHCHLDCRPSTYLPVKSPVGIVHEMDKVGVEKACVHAVGLPDPELADRFVLDALRSFPERFIGYASVNPHTLSHTKSSLDALFAEGVRGMKLYSAELECDVELLRPILSFAEERQCPVLCNLELKTVFGVASEFPRIPLILAHSEETGALELVLQRKNVYLETTSIPPVRGALEQTVERVGAERIIFGSDAPLRAFEHQIGLIVASRLPDSHKRRILGLNLMELLGLP